MKLTRCVHSARGRLAKWTVFINALGPGLKAEGAGRAGSGQTTLFAKLINAIDALEHKKDGSGSNQNIVRLLTLANFNLI